MIFKANKDKITLILHRSDGAYSKQAAKILKQYKAYEYEKIAIAGEATAKLYLRRKKHGKLNDT